MGACGSNTNTQKHQNNKPFCMFVLGGPGSGKGTQCEKLVNKYGFVHLSTGDLLREEVAEGSEKGKQLQEKMTNGELVSTADLMELVKKAMKKHGWAKSQFLLDGFPRNDENMNYWKDHMMSEVDTVGVLWLHLDTEVMKARLMSRGQGRADDNEITIQKRLDVFTNQTIPVVEGLRTKGLVCEVSSADTIDNVFSNCCDHIDRLLKSYNLYDKMCGGQKKELDHHENIVTDKEECVHHEKAEVKEEAKCEPVEEEPKAHEPVPEAPEPEQVVPDEPVVENDCGDDGGDDCGGDN